MTFCRPSKGGGSFIVQQVSVYSFTSVTMQPYKETPSITSKVKDSESDTKVLNTYLTNGFFHHYQLDESTFIFRGVKSDFQFLFHFAMKFL